MLDFAWTGILVPIASELSCHINLYITEKRRSRAFDCATQIGGNFAELGGVQKNVSRSLAKKLKRRSEAKNPSGGGRPAGRGGGGSSHQWTEGLMTSSGTAPKLRLFPPVPVAQWRDLDLRFSKIYWFMGQL